MYHCHVQFYLVGQPCRVFDVIKGMPPLEHFTHEFSESAGPERALAEGADVIIAGLEGMEAEEAVRCLLKYKRQTAELIVLADREEIQGLTEILPDIRDVWTMPMTDEEAGFRFLRWQQALKLSRDYWQTSQYLEATINSTPNLIWYKDKEGVHEKVNDSFCRAVEKSKAQVEGQRHAYIWDVEEDDPACIESEREVMENRRTLVAGEVIQTGAGTRMLTTYKSPLYDVDGSVMGTVGVAIDVTKERAYEQEIIQKNEIMGKIFATIDCGVMRHSLDGSQILSINHAALKILGYDSIEELEEAGFDVVAASVVEEDKERLRESICALKEEGDSVSVEYRVRHKNGDIVYVMGNVKLIKEKGKLLYQRFLLDCTAQKQQEKRRERRQLEMIQALSIDFNLVCYFDLDTGRGKLIQKGGSISDIYDSVFDGQVTLEESLSRYIEEYVYGEDQDMLRQATSLETLRKELTENRIYYVNYRRVREDETLYCQMKVVRAGEWESSHGIVIGFRSVDQEIRTEMEQKNRLSDALAQANKANKAKSVFLSNMSHDIRTPMNAIVGFTNLAITHIGNTEQVEEYLRKIMTSGNHLLSLINDVLDMSRIESGKIHLEEKECSLPEILHGLRNILQADIRAKQLELHIDTVDVIDEDIYCDTLRLNQVLLNLLSNSVKYTEEGGSISMRIIEKPGAPAGYANYEFHIQDNGIGMSEEFLEHIFEPFERENNSTISGIQGTGLGMAITKNIVDMMNGVINVESKQGVGTEFAVSFTFRLYSGGQEPQAISELAGCRALVVDADFNTCDSVSHMLEQLGMRAEWTMSGTEALLRTKQAAARENEYGVYLIDWLLPDMSGAEAVRAICEETGGRAPVIILTTYDWTEIEVEAREAGVTAFCEKPLFLSELRSCLYAAIRPEEARDKAADGQVKLHAGRILLAEDVELNQEIATVILNDAGFTVEVAENGRIAVDMLERSEPGYYQLVLMDVQMPVMNGYDATRSIRKLENKELASIPIIAMTANAFEEDKQEALRSGMNGHIAKPIDINILLKTLERLLG